ncbi:MAG: class I SAM-dependent methyltransferase [Acidobacteriota bacterium]
MSLSEILALVQLVNLVQPMRAFEIGTFHGRSAMNIALNCPAGAELLTLDLPEEAQAVPRLPLDEKDSDFIVRRAVGRYFGDRRTPARIRQVHGDSATFDFSPYYSECDLVLIDGSHSREYVFNDSLVALRLLSARGGLIAWHDYGKEAWPGVYMALHALRRNRPEFAELRWIEATSIAVLATGEIAARLRLQLS